MTKEPDPSRKPVLLAQILEHLLDKPLASLSFRTLAQALEVSTFTLVYHFGSRAELLSDIVGAISARDEDMRARLGESLGSLDSYFDGLEWSWNRAIQPRNLQLQRLEFEAAMMEVQDSGGDTFTRDLHAHWRKLVADALLSFGLDQENAEVEARLVVASFFGLQHDLMVNQDAQASTQVFSRLLADHRMRVEGLVRRA